MSIFWLKKMGYLRANDRYRTGTVTWTIGESKSSISIAVTREAPQDLNGTAYVNFSYTHTDHRTREKSEVDFNVPLVATPCNYGGHRYWFICPIVKGGRHCGRRVGVLYSIGKYFGCRHCGNIAYISQNYGGRNKGFVSIRDIDEAEEEVKRRYYRGKSTRKYRKVLRLEEKFEKGFMAMAKRWL